MVESQAQVLEQAAIKIKKKKNLECCFPASSLLEFPVHMINKDILKREDNKRRDHIILSTFLHNLNNEIKHWHGTTNIREQLMMTTQR